MDEVTLRRAAVMWVFVVQRQADRLRESVGGFNEALHDQSLLDECGAGRLSDAWKSYVEEQVGEGMSWGLAWTVGADQYFFLSAVAQLRKCVLKLVDDGLPEVPDDRTILLLRNFTEHWEDPTGRSAVELRGMVPDAVPGRLAYTKHDVVIEGVSVYGIVDWAMNVEHVLRTNAARSGQALPDPRKAGTVGSSVMSPHRGDNIGPPGPGSLRPDAQGTLNLTDSEVAAGDRGRGGSG